MTDLVEQVRTALARVQDPDLHQDLVALGMIRDLAVQDGTAAFRLVLTTGACPVKQQLEDECRAAALSVPGVTRAEIAVSAEVPRNTIADSLPGVRCIIGIGAGKGGVGKSTVATNLACALAAAGVRVGLMDADMYGPSVPTMMGVSARPEVSGKKMMPLMAHGVKLMSMGFMLEQRQAVPWKGPMTGRALQQFITDVSWGELDYLLVDLPPGTGDVQQTLAASVPIAGAVVVSTPQAVALADARRAVAMFELLKVPLFGIVENMSEFICPQCGHAEPIFGQGGAAREAHVLNVPFLGAVPLEPAVRIAGDDGTPIVISAPTSRSAQAFRAIAERVASQASIAALSRPKQAAAGA